jgi:hypothetical protein
MSQRSDSGEKFAGTLLGVPAPRVDSSPDSVARKPVFVRAGTSSADSDVEPPPVPRMALPSRPGGTEALFGKASELPPPSVTTEKRSSSQPGGLLAVVGRFPVLWMIGPLAVLTTLVIGVVVVASTSPKPSSPPVTAAAPAPAQDKPAAPSKAAAATKPSAPAVSEIEAKPLGSLSASELLKLAEARSERRRDAALALRKKLEDGPALAADSAVQLELLKWASDEETARDALGAMAALNGPVGADLLYEVWAGTSARTDATELAHALVYSSDVRPKATPALAVALELRQAETCEQFQRALPKALKDGDRRSLTPLMKLGNKRGCGPKKSQDCYACLRSQPDELTATINAVKSRRAPVFAAP